MTDNTATNYVSSCGCTAGNCGCHSYYRLQAIYITSTEAPSFKTYEEELMEWWLMRVEEMATWHRRLVELKQAHARPCHFLPPHMRKQNWTWRQAPR